MTKGTLMYERKTKCVYECKENNEIEVSSFNNEEGEYIIGRVDNNIAFVSFSR